MNPPEVGSAVRIKRGRRSNHTPCVGESGVVKSAPSNPDEPFGYAIHLPKPFELHPHGMTVNYHLEELEVVS